MINRKRVILTSAILAISITAAVLAGYRKPDGDQAYRALESMVAAELEFRDKDIDRNGIHDFWTGDITTLFRHGLISREIAQADAAPIIPLVLRPIPYHGYYFITVEWDGYETVPESLQQDTDGKSGKIHHLRKVAFCAFPAYPNPFSDHYAPTYLAGAGMLTENLKGYSAGKPVRRWPNGEERAKYWGLMCLGTLLTCEVPIVQSGQRSDSQRSCLAIPH